MVRLTWTREGCRKSRADTLCANYQCRTYNIFTYPVTRLDIIVFIFSLTFYSHILIDRLLMEIAQKTGAMIIGRLSSEHRYS